jgi:hypothetical protein
MNDLLSIKQEQITQLCKKLVSESNLEKKKSKINNLNTVCKEIAKYNNDMDITRIVENLNKMGTTISVQSIYNKQKGLNPYRRLFDAWSEYSCLKNSAKSTKITTKKQTELIDEVDISKIENAVIRYKVSLAFGELKGLRKQNDMLRQIKELPSIQAVPTHSLELHDAESIMLNSYEVDLIKNFLSGNSLLTFDDDGVLKAKMPIRKDSSLSAEGLQDALTKIIKSYKGISN